MRAEAREHIQGNQRRILERLERLQNLHPEDVEEECRISDSVCKASDAFIRAHASLASMYGLNAPEGNGSGSGNTTNNTINSINMGESEFLRHLCNVKGIKLANG